MARASKLKVTVHRKRRRLRSQEEIQATLTVSPRVAASRKNGKRGGQAVANKYGAEWRIARASSGGLTTKARYGTEYFRHIRSLRRTWNGEVKDQPRKRNEAKVKVASQRRKVSV